MFSELFRVIAYNLTGIKRPGAANEFPLRNDPPG
jgi:hypothetical protein